MENKTVLKLVLLVLVGSITLTVSGLVGETTMLLLGALLITALLVPRLARRRIVRERV